MNYRKISRQFLAYLPEKIRLSIMRNRLTLNHDWPSPLLEIQIAKTESELEAAYRLLHDSYVKAGFMNADITKMRVLAQHLLPQTTTIIAKWDSKVIGTLSLIRDNPFGLPLEKIFDIDERRAGGRRLAEVSSLAVDPNYRGQVNTALFPLFRFVAQYARHYFGIHEFAIAVNPSMVDLYLGVLCFERLKAKPKAYDFVKGAPAVGLYLNFETADERWKKVFAHKKEEQNFYKYWSVLPDHPNYKLPEREYHSVSDPILTPQLLADFFLDKAQLSKKLVAKEVQLLMDVYPFAAYQKILQPLYDTLSRKSLRLETQMKAQFETSLNFYEVLNVSKGGLLVRGTDIPIAKGQQSYINVQLNNSTTARLKVEMKRGPRNGLFGLQILESTQQWMHMIDTLENDYRKKAQHLKTAA